MFADLAAVPADHLKWILVTVLAVATPVAAWLGLYFGRRQSVEVRPQPLQVQGVERFVSRDLCEQMHHTSAKDIADLKVRVAALESGQREMVRELGEQISEVRSEVTDGLRRVHDRVDGMPAQIVVLLRNTGAIQPRS